MIFENFSADSCIDSQKENFTISYFGSLQYLQTVAFTIGYGHITPMCHLGKVGSTPVGINEKGFVISDFGMFLLLDYCIENERGSVGTPLCRVLINVSSKSLKIVYFSQNCYFHVM